MAYVDLAEELPFTSSDDSTGLCAVCQKIDFVSWTREDCCDSHDRRHFHIGLVRHVASKTFCPGCRLILSTVEAEVVKPSSGTIGEKSITIRTKFQLAHQRIRSDDVRAIEQKTEGVITVKFVQMESLIEVTLGADRFEPKRKMTRAIIRSGSHEIGDNFQTAGKIFDLEASVERFRVRGRPVLPTVNLSLIRDWMHFCDTQHDKCRLFAKEPSEELMIRLIDVQERKIVPASQKERYVALSYVWGRDTEPMLTLDTLPSYSSPNSLQESMIPGTILNAIQLVSDIGERYLWVDSLCIVQNDHRDKLKQLAIMDSIFKSASLVVVAATGCDAYAGLPGMGNIKRRICQQSETVNGICFTTTQPTVRQALDESKWDTRGWTFQEAMLAQRILVFA
jgi:Heterokaryon incompatibility protein (HET)